MLHHTRSTAENLYYLQGKLYQFSQYWLVGLKFSNIRMIQRKHTCAGSNCLYKELLFTENHSGRYSKLFGTKSKLFIYNIYEQSWNLSERFLTEFRISRGKEQLALTNLSVEEIAVSCGYRNSLAFGKVFKQKVGITPTQYRNNNRKDARERLIRAQNELKEYKKHKTIYVGNIEKNR